MDSSTYGCRALCHLSLSLFHSVDWTGYFLPIKIVTYFFYRYLVFFGPLDLFTKIFMLKPFWVCIVHSRSSFYLQL